jgi:CRISPR-associated RAMP protein (TIGR02581 family)
MPDFKLRYVFTGRLALTTALHIGGGRGTLAPTDSPIIRGPDLKPFVPGSSLKGSFRSTVEKLASAASLSTCALIENAHCPGAPGGTQKEFNRRKEDWDEVTLIDRLFAELCFTCQLFGSPFKASKIYFDDLSVLDWAEATQIRDGVAIDRDSDRAVDRLKYDYEVIPPGASFDFRVTLEEPSEKDLSLTSLGLSEFVAGFGGIGGKRSRGMGRCVLENLKVYELDLRQEDTRADRLKKYLLGKTLEEKMTRLPDTTSFLQARINELL